MTGTLRAGVIGLGVGVQHARGYMAAQGAELSAICDLSEARLAERGGEFPPEVARYTDYHKMLAEGGLDVVSVCLPNTLHPMVTIDALEAGLHVVCEKPLAASVTGAEQIAEAVRRAEGLFTVCYDKRYRADTRWVREACAAGELGEIYHVEAAWTRETGIPGGWFSRKADAGGGPLIDLGVHILDLALWTLDFPQVQAVSGMTRAVFGPAGRKTWGTKSGGGGSYDVEDGAVGLLRLAGNVPLLLHASWADHRRPGEDDIALRVAGSKGAAQITIRNYTQTDTLRVFTEINGAAVEARPNLAVPRLNGHAGLIAAFVEAIHSGGTPPAPVDQGLVTVRTLDAFYRSAAEGREIRL